LLLDHRLLVLRWTLTGAQFARLPLLRTRFLSDLVKYIVLLGIIFIQVLQRTIGDTKAAFLFFFLLKLARPDKNPVILFSLLGLAPPFFFGSPRPARGKVGIPNTL